MIPRASILFLQKKIVFAVNLGFIVFAEKILGWRLLSHIFPISDLFFLLQWAFDLLLEAWWCFIMFVNTFVPWIQWLLWWDDGDGYNVEDMLLMVVVFGFFWVDDGVWWMLYWRWWTIVKKKMSKRENKLDVVESP